MRHPLLIRQFNLCTTVNMLFENMIKTTTLFSKQILWQEDLYIPTILIAAFKRCGVYGPVLITQLYHIHNSKSEVAFKKKYPPKAQSKYPILSLKPWWCLFSIVVYTQKLNRKVEWSDYPRHYQGKFLMTRTIELSLKDLVSNYCRWTLVVTSVVVHTYHTYCNCSQCGVHY